jgi:hypothetical protein
MRTLFFAFFGCCMSCLLCAQELDPCKFNRKPTHVNTPTDTPTDSITPKNKWGYFEMELKPDINLLFSSFASKNCKVQANTINRLIWQKAGKKSNVGLLVEQRLGGMVYPDSLRKLSNDEARIQVNATRITKKMMHPTPSIHAEVKTALFKNYEIGMSQPVNAPQGWLLPGTSIISAGFKCEKPGMGGLDCGIAGLKIDWLRKNNTDSLLLLAYPNLSTPYYRSVNGGLHVATLWNCELGKKLKLEHSSRFFKPVLPQFKRMDIEVRNTLIFSTAKGIQTSIRQSYTINQSLGTPADFRGEIVMGYVFLKQKGKR